MKRNYYIIAALVALVTICQSSVGAARSSPDEILTGDAGLVCPEGFRPIPSGLACVAKNFTGSPAAEPVGEDCPKGFERIPGINFCVARNITLAMQGDVILLAGNSQDHCPEGFSTAVGSTVCTADDLVLAVSDNALTLQHHPDHCSKGFHRPPGVAVCIAEDLAAKAGPVQTCPPGFVKPPGVNFCIATRLILDQGVDGLEGLDGGIGCPAGWHRPPHVNFCIPSTEAVGCGYDCRDQGYDAVYFHPSVKDLAPTPCPAGMEEIWWDAPEYDEEGLFVVGTIPTRTCIPENLEPAG